MTRTVPSPRQTALDTVPNRSASLWTIIRRDLTVLRFTDHDRDIPFGGNIYVSARGYQRTGITNNATLAVDTLDVEGILDAAEITETDMRGGRYDHASVRLADIDWSDPDGLGEVSLRKGWFGEIEFDETTGSFKTELRGLTQVYSQNIVEQFARYCRYDVGDGRCNRDNLVPILPDEIQASTAYAVGDIVRVPRVGAASPPITEDYQDVHYTVTTAGTTGTGVNNFPTLLATVATPATTLAVDDTNTFSRAAGSFLDDGWEVDMVFTSAGFTDAANNGTFRVAAVTALTLDVTASTLVAEAGTGDETLSHVAYNNGVVFSLHNALRVAGEVLVVFSQSRVIVGPPAGGGLLARPLYFENAGFETGDLTGWTITIPGEDPGNIVVSSPSHSGTYSCELSRGWINSGGDTEMNQVRDVSDYAAQIDAGGQTINVSWWHIGFNGGLAASEQILFDWLDQNGTLISTHTGIKQQDGGGTWLQFSEQGTIPALTRKIRIRLWAGDLTGDHYVDDFTISSSLVDPNFPDDEFNYGVATFDGGLNAGLSESVKDYDGLAKTFTLYLSMPYPIAVGDKVGVHIGCNSEPSRCLALGNKLNFGGCEDIPGDDEFLSYPDSPY